MIRGIGRWFWHVFEGMVRGCLTLALLAAVISFGTVYLTTHTLPAGVTLGLVVTIIIISGILGAAFMLIWRLSHIEELTHVASEVVDEVTHHGR